MSRMSGYRPAKPGKSREQIEAELEKAKQEANAARPAVAQAETRLQKANKDCDQLREELDTSFPPQSQAETYQAAISKYWEEKRKQAAEQGEVQVAPIDLAFRRRRGFGLQRPYYPVARK